MTLRDLPTPCAVVDADRLEANLDAMARIASASGKRLRPHLKTHKCIEIARMQALRGARGVTVAKLGEAEVFANAGFDDIFVANLIVGSDKLERLAHLVASADVTVGLDSEAVLEGLKRAAAAAPRTIGVYIEVDTGHHRTGVRALSQAGLLAYQCRSVPGLEVRGVYTHEGHVYKAAAYRLQELCQSVASSMRDYAEVCGTDTISVGSTPSASVMAAVPSVTEIRPGNYVFYDATQVRLGASADACALTVMATVIATPTPSDAFVDAGSKALSGDKDPDGKHGYVWDLPDVTMDWCSEEHGHLDLSHSPGALRVGDRVRIVPAHACTCVNCHDVLHAANGDTVVETWPVAARGRLT